jgi:hypothetical protein
MSPPHHEVRQRLLQIFRGNQLHGLTTAIIVVFLATVTTTLILTWKLKASSAISEVFTQLLGSNAPTDQTKSRWLIFCKWLNLQATSRLKQMLITNLLLHYKRCHWTTHFLWKLLWKNLIAGFECLTEMLLKIQAFRDKRLCWWVSSSTVFRLTDPADEGITVLYSTGNYSTETTALTTQKTWNFMYRMRSALFWNMTQYRVVNSLSTSQDG